MPFSKPAISIEEQIELLRLRGLIIDNDISAKHYLLHIGYYRLAGYWQQHQKDPVKHIFLDNTTIDQIIDLYSFDRELRLLLIDAIERIEVSFRSVLINELCCRYGPAWYADVQLAFREDVFYSIMDTIDSELSRTNEPFIKHHDEKYGQEDYPPAWKTLQIVSFGTLSRIYGNIRNEITERKAIAKLYGLPSEGWMHSWLQVISVLRNYCAHHSRVCNRIFPFPPKDMNRSVLPWIKKTPTTTNSENQKLYYQLCAVRYFLRIGIKRIYGNKNTVIPAINTLLPLRSIGHPQILQ